MAETEAEALPNGTGALSTEEEDERLKQRPADIDADVREMERRKRVEALMSSKLFREELERVLDQQIHEGSDAPLLQRIREMVGGRLHTGSLRGPACVLPINDIRGIEGVGYEKGEKILRCKLAAVYRLVDLFGWTQTGVTGQITARLNTAIEQVLTTPRGLLPHEVTASSLVKVDMQGVVQDQGTTNFPVNVEGFSLHASVHAARPDVRCVLHVRSAAALAISSTKRGLLPLCQEAALLGDIAYHRVPYGPLDNEERDKLVRALGPSAKVLVLTSGGALCCGATLEEAFFQARNLTAACDVQLRLASLPLDELVIIDEDTRRQMYEASRKPPSDQTKWRVGGEEFEALMRMLDNAGFRTGYIYRHPLVKNDVPKPKNDVEVPPAVSSLGYLLEEEELYRQGLWKKGQGKTGERTRWLNSPNVYQKVEVLETGTPDPKKITKWVDANNEEWVQDGSPAHSSTPVKIDTLQFVPKNTNPKEFKQLQQQIKDYRRADKISAGPQSHILEGVTWDEASKLIGEDAVNTHTGDHVVLMGAASKGIIQRGYQHNATVYSAPYARNPFDQVTDNEIDEYKRIVERKQRPNEYDTDLSESEAISAAQITSPASAPSETEEESRDEHRVLRIETKQVPVRSQPEVVLSDVDATDFLNAERAHADRTKARELMPLSDDEVFLPTVPQVVHTRHIIVRDPARDPNLLSDDEVFLDSPASTVTSSVTSPEPIRQVVVRTQHMAVQQRVTRGNSTAKEATSTRTKHEYSRNANFDNILKLYDSPHMSQPKCKLSLTTRLPQGDVSSHSSLVSIPSIEWDGRCKSEYGLRTRSLTRQKTQKLYRTRSHSGFINAYVKDPEPVHYHLPRCSSCGATNVSYAWEVKNDRKVKIQSSVYYSVDNLPQKCFDEAAIVKVQEKFVPVLKLEKKDAEFVESQEFNEDNYIGDLGNSFSSDNQTVIEKEQENDATIVNNYDSSPNKKDSEEQTYKAEVAYVEPNDDDDKTLDTTEGEYHSFTDDFEEAYESPVKQLVEKDIRDYSVPINTYCDDYGKKSPLKTRESKIVLEPILEESKSSYGDESNTSQNCKKENKSSDITAHEAINKDVPSEHLSPNDTVDATEMDTSEFMTPENNTNENELFEMIEHDNINNNIPTVLDLNTIQQNVTAVDNAEKISVNFDVEDCLVQLIVPEKHKNKRHSSLASTMSSNDVVSFDSTAEFEKYEFVADFIACILNRIEYHIETVSNLMSETGNYKESANDDTHDNVETFSITKMIEDMEQNIHLSINDTNSTEGSDIDAGHSTKIIESILYYLFNRVIFISQNENKPKKHCDKRVVTIVDSEDILFTTKPLWISFTVEEEFNSIKTEIDKLAPETQTEFHTIDNESAGLEILRQSETISQVIMNIVDYENFTPEPRINFDSQSNKCSDYDEQCDECKDEAIATAYDMNATYDTIPHNTEDSIDHVRHEIESHNETFIESHSDMNNAFLADVSHLSPVKVCTSPKPENNFNVARNVNEEISVLESSTLDAATYNLDDTINDNDNSQYNDSNEEDLCNNFPDQNDSIEIMCNRRHANRRYRNKTMSSSPKDFEHHNTSIYEDIHSPFIKKPRVITMSQTEHSGGLKYWISFDENFAENDRRSIRCIRNADDTLPSFVAIDLDDSRDVIDKDVKRTSLLNDLSDHPSFDSNIEFDIIDSKYESIKQDAIATDKTMLYSVHKRPTKRLYTSWPPFEHTLFYKIISKFRMSDSFDPSELEDARIDSV